MSESPTNDPTLPPVPKLDYAAPDGGGMVRLASYGTADDAELHASELAAEGIPARILNAYTNALGIPYTGLADVELHVHAADAARAAEVLARDTNQEMEPLDDPADAAAPVEEDGQPLQLVPAAAYDNVRALRDAQTILASAHLRSFLPTLVPRGDRPPGVGKRFVLRVAQEDLERAQALLQEAEEDAGEDEPRCPKCRSWRVYRVAHFWNDLASLVGMGQKAEAQMECLACKYRGPVAEFTPAVSQ